MSGYGGLSGAAEPLLTFGAVGCLVLLLRWAFAHNTSLIERRSRAGAPKEYGLLVRVAAPATITEAQVIHDRLRAAGLRATLAPTTQGPAVMVFPEDVGAAERILRQ